MAITIATLRGSSATTTGSTWASTANAYDGTPGTNTATYATLSAVATGTTSTLKISGYNFIGTTIDNVQANSVTVTIRGFVTTANRWANPTIQAYLGSTALGSAVATSGWTTTAASYTVTLSGITGEQVLDPTFSIQANFVRSGAQTDGLSVDFIDVSMNYSYRGWGYLDLHS